MLSQKDDGKLIDRKEDDKLIRNKDKYLIDRKNDGKLMHPDEEAELFLTHREKGMRGKIQNSELSEDYKIHKKEDHPILKLLREKDTMRHAVILSEILRRKW